jgi:hypothetical protein
MLVADGNRTPANTPRDLADVPAAPRDPPSRDRANRDAYGDWDPASCNLGVAKSDLFGGLNGWRLPAWECDVATLREPPYQCEPANDALTAALGPTPAASRAEARSENPRNRRTLPSRTVNSW